MARPGVRQTLHNISNNVNKRASILRFYRPVLSIFDNAPRSRDSRWKRGRMGDAEDEWTCRASESKSNPNRRVNVVGLFGKNRVWRREWESSRGWKRIAKKQIKTVALGSAIIFVVTIALRVVDDARAQLKRALAIKYAWCGIFGARIFLPLHPAACDRAAKKQVGKFEEGNYSQRCASCNEAT